MSKEPLLSAPFLSFIKEKRSLVIILCICLGVGLMLLGVILPTGEQPDDAGTLAEYKRTLEAELSELCSGVSGAGRCIVTVSFSEDERLEYKGSNLIGRTPPRVGGITVLARGADSERVQAEISEMLSALFGIGQNRICVLKLSL